MPSRVTGKRTPATQRYAYANREACHAGTITRTLMEHLTCRILHTHRGFDAAYLLAGGLTVLERAQPDKWSRPGESWRVPPGSVHEVKTGDQTTKVLAI
jgi:hypothetical protein